MKKVQNEIATPIDKDTLYEINIRYGINPFVIENSILLTDIDDLSKELEKMSDKKSNTITILNHLISNSEKLGLVTTFYENKALANNKNFILLKEELPQLDKKALKNYIICVEYDCKHQDLNILNNKIKTVSDKNYKNVICILSNFNQMSEDDQIKITSMFENKNTTLILMSQIIHDVVITKEVKSLYRVEQENLKSIIIGV